MDLLMTHLVIVILLRLNMLTKYLTKKILTIITYLVLK